MAAVDPLDIKSMSQSESAIPSSSPTNSKTYKCDTCNTTYSDKMYYDLHKQSHKDNNMPVFQIVMNSGNSQVVPQSVTQHQSGTQIVIPEDQLSAYKRVYGIDSQVYAIAPVTQYQLVSANSRGGTVSIPPSQGQIMSYNAAPTYVVATVDGQQSIQPVQEQQLDNQEHLQQHNLQTHQQQQQQVHHQPQQTQMHTPQSNLHVIQSNNQQNHITPITTVASSATATTTVSTNQRSSRCVVNTIKNRPYKCDQCTASFIEESELEEHKKKHTGDGPFTCEDCHFTFMYKSHFKSHKTRCQKKRAMMPTSPKQIYINPPIKREFPIPQTGQNIIKQQQTQHFIQPQILNQTSATKSIKASSGPRQNKQAIKFNPNNPSFKRIKKEVRLDRPFECDECDASFQTDEDLKCHKTKHTGEGPFRCEECKFVFLYRKLFEAHKRRCEKKRKEAGLPVSSVPSTSTVSVPHGAMLPGDIVHNSVAQVSNIHSHQDVQMHSTPSISALDSTIQTLNQQPIQMQSHIGQPQIIEMRTIGQQGDVHHIVPSHSVLEQVIVNQAGQPIDGDCVNQIMNLIKKGNQ